MKGGAVGAVANLMSAARSGGCDQCVGGLISDGGKEDEFSGLHGNVVVFAFVPE